MYNIVQLSSTFNTVRLQNINKPLSRKEVQNLLSEFPYHSQGYFVTVLVEINVLKKEGRKFYFTDKPVYKEHFQTLLSKLTSTASNYNTKMDVQKAIKVLLETGEYEIYKLETITKKVKL